MGKHDRKYNRNIEPPKNGPKILTLDVETSPHLAMVWGLFDQNVSLSQLREATQVICWAAKWIGKPGVEFRSDFHDGHLEQVRRIHELVDQADIIVGYNSRSFDMKHLNREFLLAGLNPPSPYKQVDLLTEVRRNFKMASNKLNYVSQVLGIGEKTQHSGQALWNACIIDKDPKAWALMRSYNVQDTRLNEQVYNAILPWLKHPNVALYSEEARHTCPTCNSTDLQRRGYSLTAVGKYQRYQCNKCGSWSKSGRRLDTAVVRSA